MGAAMHVRGSRRGARAAVAAAIAGTLLAGCGGASSAGRSTSALVDDIVRGLGAERSTVEARLGDVLEANADIVTSDAASSRFTETLAVLKEAAPTAVDVACKAYLNRTALLSTAEGADVLETLRALAASEAGGSPLTLLDIACMFVDYLP